MKLKMPIIFITATIAASAYAKTVLDFSTSNSANWSVSAGGVVNAAPFTFSYYLPYFGWNGPVISITSDGLSDGTFVSGGSLANFDGFWTATYTFYLPPGANNVSLDYSSLYADDRAVLELNGTPIGSTGLYGPGQGNMVLTDCGASESYYFNGGWLGGSSGVSGIVTNGFNIGGQNTLTAVINNTAPPHGINGSMASIASSQGDHTGFAVNGTISYDQTQPVIVGAQGLKYPNNSSPSELNLSLASGGQLYVYGATTGGAYPMSAFANGKSVQITNANGNVSAELSVTTNSSNSYTTSTANDAFGGFGVSGFNYAQGFYGVNLGPGPNLQASVQFSLSAPALVVVMGLGSSQATLTFSGLDNPNVDVSEVDGIYEPVLGIEHEYLNAGTYTIQETTGDGTAYYQTPQNEVDLIGVLIFATSPNAASSGNPTIPIPASFQQLPPPTVTTGTASAITANSATLNGSVNPNGLSTTAYFQLGTDTNYGNTVPNPALSCGSGNTISNLTVTLTGLTPNTTYHYQLVASSSAGTAYGTDHTFTLSYLLQQPFNPSTQDVVLAGGNGIHNWEGAAQSAEVFNGKVYYAIRTDGSSLPSKIYCFDPVSSNNAAVLTETTDDFWALKAMKGDLWVSHINGNLWESADGVNFTEIAGTPFSATNYVTAMAEFNGQMYFATSDGNIYASPDGSTFNLTSTISPGYPIRDMTAWNGYLYGANQEYYDIPLSLYTNPQPSLIFRTGDGADWTVLNTNDTYEFFGFVPTSNYLYLASMEDPNWASLAFRSTTDGTNWTRFFYTESEGKQVSGHPTYFSQTGRVYYLSSWNGIVELFPVFNGVMESRMQMAHGFSSVVEANGQLFGIGSQDTSNWESSPFVVSLLGNYNIVPQPTPPVAGTAYYMRPANVSLKIPISDLLTNVTVAAGDCVTLIGVGTDGFNLLSTNGTTLFTNSTYILYTNSVTPNVNDSFNYAVSDALGQQAIGTVYITMNTNPIVGQSSPNLIITSTNITATFFGVPGYQYTAERSTNLLLWVPISTNIAPAIGVFQVIDNFQDLGIPIPPVPSPVYYRLLYP